MESDSPIFVKKSFENWPANSILNQISAISAKTCMHITY
jgi:hypothetical protein